MPDSKVPILLVASRFGMPYRALRCAQGAGAAVHVLGTAAAAGLGRSRYCRYFKATSVPIDGTRSEALAAEINALARQLGIDAVIAGDAPATRSLLASADLLQVRTFPMPSLSDFDLLNSKWSFSLLCQSTGIQHPQTQLFTDLAELESYIAADKDQHGFIAKPLSMDSSKGVVTLRSSTFTAAAARLSYRPILLQEYIQGQDIGASVFCREGQVESFIAHYYARGTYYPFLDSRIRNDIQTMLGSLKTTGIFNFDMRRTSDGRVYYLECNPRVFWKISMSMLAGINFISAGLSLLKHTAAPAAPAALRTVRFPKALLLQAATAPWRLEAASLQTLKFLLADPLPYYREMLGLEHDPVD